MIVVAFEIWSMGGMGSRGRRPAKAQAEVTYLGCKNASGEHWRRIDIVASNIF